MRDHPVSADPVRAGRRPTAPSAGPPPAAGRPAGAPPARPAGHRPARAHQARARPRGLRRPPQRLRQRVTARLTTGPGGPAVSRGRRGTAAGGMRAGTAAGAACAFVAPPAAAARAARPGPCRSVMRSRTPCTAGVADADREERDEEQRELRDRFSTAFAAGRTVRAGQHDHRQLRHGPAGPEDDQHRLLGLRGVQLSYGGGLGGDAVDDGLQVRREDRGEEHRRHAVGPVEHDRRRHRVARVAAQREQGASRRVVDRGVDDAPVADEVGRGVALVAHVDAEELHPPGRGRRGDLVERGGLGAAGPAPRAPDVEHHDLAG